MKKLEIQGSFEVPDGVSQNEALLRLSIRLKQIATGNDPKVGDWQGAYELKDAEPKK